MATILRVFKTVCEGVVRIIHHAVPLLLLLDLVYFYA